MLELDDIQSGVLRPRPTPYVATYIALRIDDRDLFDLLAADVELLQGMFRALLGVESRGRAVE